MVMIWLYYMKNTSEKGNEHVLNTSNKYPSTKQNYGFDPTLDWTFYKEFSLSQPKPGKPAMASQPETTDSPRPSARGEDPAVKMAVT